MIKAMKKFSFFCWFIFHIPNAAANIEIENDTNIEKR